MTLSSASIQVPTPSVSVLMPVLDPDPRFFREAIEAVLTQTHSDLELIITEDPGRRSGETIVAELNDPRIVYQRNKERTRLIYQRNQGLASARGDLVALADADDICAPDRLEKQVAFLTSHPEVDLLSGQIEVIDENGQVLGSRHYPQSHAEIIEAMPSYNPIAQPAMMFRKRAILEIGGYAYEHFNTCSDYDLWCRANKAGARFANLGQVLVRYRVHSGQLKAAHLKESLAATLDIKRAHFKGRMGLESKLRYLAERLLLFLPSPLVLSIFKRIQYGR